MDVYKLVISIILPNECFICLVFDRYLMNIFINVNWMHKVIILLYTVFFDQLFSEIFERELVKVIDYDFRRTCSVELM